MRWPMKLLQALRLDSSRRLCPSEEGSGEKEIRKDLGYVMTEILRSARDLVGASVGSKGQRT